jgi:hypothetical protein
MGMTIAAMPAFNEEANIAKLVLQAEQHVDTVVVVGGYSGGCHGLPKGSWTP